MSLAVCYTDNVKELLAFLAKSILTESIRIWSVIREQEGKTDLAAEATEEDYRRD